MATVILWGATYNNVPALDVPSTGSTTARFIDEEEIVTYYTGSSTPSSSLGSDGDIYLKTV